MLTRRRVRPYPNQCISERQEIILGVLFGLLGLWVTSLAFLNADALIGAVDEWSSEGFSRPAAAVD